VGNPLDNHFWHALNGASAQFSRPVGSGVRLLAPDIASAAAMESVTSATCRRSLRQFVPAPSWWSSPPNQYLQQQSSKSAMSSR
jgi:hypothetical protein